jgi:hypothetical protein
MTVAEQVTKNMKKKIHHSGREVGVTWAEAYLFG